LLFSDALIHVYEDLLGSRNLALVLLYSILVSEPFVAET
jgi:hypothetical protein